MTHASAQSMLLALRRYSPQSKPLPSEAVSVFDCGIAHARVASIDPYMHTIWNEVINLTAISACMLVLV
jgi:hypothetical protein